jgi:outer membrane protein assembly factor BamB
MSRHLGPSSHLILDGLVFGLAVLTAVVSPSDAAGGSEPSAAEILQTTGIQGGVIVHLGCGDGRLTAALGAGPGRLVQGLDADPKNVQRARDQVRSAGLYGTVSVDHLAGPRLPYIDNLVNLVVAESLSGVDMQEVLRVLRPEGVAYVRVDGEWRKTIKPALEGADEWTHYLHDPSNNAVAHDSVVGPPRHMQWVGGPRYSRHHDRMSSVSAVVSAGGRVFSIFDEASPASILIAPQWRLIARDAYNGTVLWKRDISRWHTHLWPLKSGPAQLPRRLVADGDRVYVTLSIDGPVVALDAASGETVRTYPETAGTEEILFSDGQLLLLVNPGGPDPELTGPEQIRRGYNASLWDGAERELMLVDAGSGRVQWSRKRRVLPVTLAGDARTVVFHDGSSVVCLDRATGDERWRSVAVERTEKLLGFFAPTLVLYDGVVLFAGGETAGLQTGSWYTEGKDTLTALAADDGRVLWTAYHPPSGYRSAEDVLVANGLVWTGETTSGRAEGVFSGRDPHTGEVKTEFPPDVSTYWFHHRCYRGKATDRYLLMSRTGIEFLDLQEEHWIPHHWVRGACLYGIMPANGLVYAPQHPCACYLEAKMYGFNALSGAERGEIREPAQDQRLERGPAYASAWPPEDASSVRSGDWPTYRHDSARSGRATTSVPADLQIHWTQSLGKRLSSPVIAEGRLFVAEVDRHTVHALDAESGRQLWAFTAGGRIDSPPTIHRGLALFGSADGYVYALRARDGQLAWRFLAAATDQRLGSFGQLESVWPVPGNVLVQDGVLFCVAGRSMFLDGGLRMWRLDPETGQVLSETPLDDGSSDASSDPQAYVSWLNMPTALPDILSCDGRLVYMRSQPFRLDGTRLPLEAMPTTGDADRGAPEPTQSAEFAHLFSPTGFLDDTNWHRTYWMYGSRFISGWSGYFLAGKAAPAGKLLVFDDHKVYGFGRKPKYFRWSTPIEHQLFAARKPGTEDAAPDVRPDATSGPQRPAGFSVVHDWSRDLPILARGLVLSDGRLFVAGPPDLVDEEAAFRAFEDPQVQEQMGRQAEALDGAAGGRLCVVSAADGDPLSELVLDSPPRFDGMAAAAGRLYVVTQNGAVICLGGS